MEDRVSKIIGEYRLTRDKYDNFSTRMGVLVKEILDCENIRYLSVEDRAKTVESLEAKLADSKYSRLTDVHDLAGVRIITYVYSDIREIEKTIRKSFQITEVRAEDDLEVDKVGYRSRHYLISLPPSRLKLAEYSRFKGLIAELQVCTVLQHAWAQIGHNQIYKPSSTLPREIKRGFILLAGLLEIADNEFSRISVEINKFERKVQTQTKKGDLDIPIDIISLKSFCDEHFKKVVVNRTFGPNDSLAQRIVEELYLMGINSLEELNNIMPKGFQAKLSQGHMKDNYAGIIRNLLIIHNRKLYFEKAWRNSWQGLSSDFDLFRAFGIDPEKLATEFNLTLQKKAG